MAKTRRTSKKQSAGSTIGSSIKGAIMDLGVNLGLIENTRLTTRQEQNLVSDIIAESQKLRSRLQAINFRSSKIPMDQMAAEQRKIAVLIVKLDDTMMSNTPDTREIDKVLYKLCDHLQEAYRRGDTLSAHYIVETLVYGVASGHKPLLEDEKEREEEILVQREKKLNTYLQITQAAENAFQCSASVKANTEKLKSDSKELKDQMKEIEDFKHDEKNPENAKAMEIVQAAGGRMNKLSGAAFILASMMKSAVHTNKECELLKKQIGLTKADINNYHTLISQLEITLNVPNEHAKKELMEYAKQMGAELQQRVNQQVNDILEMNATLNDYYTAMESVFQQPRLEDFVLSALEEYEQMQYELEEEAAAYGRMMEKEKYNEQDLEAEDSLFN